MRPPSGNRMVHGALSTASRMPRRDAPDSSASIEIEDERHGWNARRFTGTTFVHARPGNFPAASASTPSRSAASWRWRFHDGGVQLAAVRPPRGPRCSSPVISSSHHTILIYRVASLDRARRLADEGLPTWTSRSRSRSDRVWCSAIPLGQLLAASNACAPGR